MSEWWKWLRDISRAATNVEIANRVGVSGATVGNWARGSRPAAEQVIMAARVYGANALAGLIAAGYMTEDEITAWGANVQPPTPLGDMPDRELLDELERRLNLSGAPGNLHLVPDDEADRSDLALKAAMTETEDDRTE